jgi:hypothetical protein
MVATWLPDGSVCPICAGPGRGSTRYPGALCERCEGLVRDRDGKAATVVRKETSCWIRGNLDEDVVFLMDNVHPREDDPGGAGYFYNKAPRFTVLGNGYLNCEPFK